MREKKEGGRGLAVSSIKTFLCLKSDNIERPINKGLA